MLQLLWCLEEEPWWILLTVVAGDGRALFGQWGQELAELQSDSRVEGCQSSLSLWVGSASAAAPVPGPWEPQLAPAVCAAVLGSAK